MVADMVAFVASQFTTSTWDVGAQELCSVVLITDFYLYLGRKEIWNLVFDETTTRQMHGFAQAFSARLSYM